ncbi:hypothetical protein [Erythrobacter sp. JK5]|uniref:hypothetical protein n=1 Tax=Erythrobacter sp. JK5 TaxID=2829500 RepID=UPI001BAB4354|nr:hypothetical protein [Erythrobacter sp. JK5]QUL38754.1 hypothetical protein KDC96_05105 [Erythrobacter sp. JK5]
MSYPEDPHGPRSYGRMHLVLSHVAAVSFLVMVLSRFEVIPTSFGVIGITFGVLSLVVMFTTRNSDEWIASLWSAGANAGFFAAMAWLLILPFAEGAYDGLLANERRQDLPTDLASFVAMGAFLVAFNLKRLRGY